MFCRYMRYETKTVVRQRTEEEKIRRHLFGDQGAKFKARQFAIGGDVMTALTTVTQKDNIIFEIIWI